jgi:hypothetical protein
LPDPAEPAGLVELAAVDGSLRILTLSQLMKNTRRPFCQTVHSLQGQTFNNRVYIHDISQNADEKDEKDNGFISYTWVRTAVSRATTLDIVIVSGSGGGRISKTLVDAKIMQHAKYDKEHGHDLHEMKNSFISFDWVKYKIKYQQFACHTCSAPLGTGAAEFSIDRIINTLPHTKKNCAIACLQCQAASAHRS